MWVNLVTSKASYLLASSSVSMSQLGLAGPEPASLISRPNVSVSLSHMATKVTPVTCPNGDLGHQNGG